MAMSTNTLRPYYNPDTFNSPVKGSEGLTVVYNTSTATKSLGAASPSAANDGNFVYLDVEINGSSETAAIGLTMARLYSRVFISQPFEVSRLLLQVGDWNNRPKAQTDQTDSSPVPEDDESDEEIDYFTDVPRDTSLQAIESRTKGARLHGLRSSSVASNSAISSSAIYTSTTSTRNRSPPVHFPNAIEPVSVHILDIMRALTEKDGMVGLWRGLHTSFVLEALTLTVESWLSGFFSSICGIPDPHFVDVLHSPSPMASLGTVVSAAVVTSLILSPVDVIRTRLAVTTFSTSPRSFRQSLVELRSYTSPLSVLIPTALRSGVSSAIRGCTPYLLYRWVGIDRTKYRGMYNFARLVSSILELGLRLPLETITRRSHIASLELDSASLVVHPVAYHGMFSTFWRIGSGQDRVESLFQGWRLSLIGAIGEWGLEPCQTNRAEKEHF